MSCMSDITSLAFSFHTRTFFTKVRISWNSWPSFSCWLRSCDVDLRLGSRVCVCVCLFCSVVVVVLFVIGWQQHCRYIVIDAMVYPKNWILEDEFGTGKTLRSLDWVWYFYIWFCDGRRFWIWKLRHCAWIERDEFWDDASSSILRVGRRTVFDYLLIMNVIWNHETLRVFNPYNDRSEHLSVQCSDVIGWDVMSKGGMEIWHPVGAPFG